MTESLPIGIANRFLQGFARAIPGARSWRVCLHRCRGVQIGDGTWIGYDCILETSRPDLIKIGRHVVISLRVILVAHFRGAEGITIEDDVFIGPGAIILPSVTIGRGSVVTAGSVVSASVPPMTVVQGNPARPIATCGATLVGETSLKSFYRSLKPLRRPPPGAHSSNDEG
jgi:acetyltransferase-like isoleucine patch superfamily enzyme